MIYTTVCRCGGAISREIADPHKVAGHSDGHGKCAPCPVGDDR